MDDIHLILTEDFELVKAKYMDAISHIPDIDKHARWVYGKHPDDELLRTYIRNREMYILTDHKNILGMVAIVMHQGKDYEPVKWMQDIANDQAATIHLLVICPEYRGHSLGRKMLEQITDIARKNGKKTLRLDTLLCNIPAQHMYEKAGFSCRGGQRLFEESLGWADFIYYEKDLTFL